MGSDRLITLVCVGVGGLIGTLALAHAAKLMLRAIAAARDPAVRATPMTPWAVFDELYTERIRPVWITAALVMWVCVALFLVMSFPEGSMSRSGLLGGLCVLGVVSGGAFLLGEACLWFWAGRCRGATSLAVASSLPLALLFWPTVHMREGTVTSLVMFALIVGGSHWFRRFVTVPGFRSETWWLDWFRAEDE